MTTYQDKLKKKHHSPIYLVTLTLLMVLGGLWWAFTAFTSYTNSHTFTKQRVFAMVWHWPLRVEPKQPQVVKITLPEYKGDINDPIKIYVCTKFGIENCRVALGIMEAESHFKEDAWHINNNGTIDVGIWQINSTHFNQEGCDIKSDLDPIRATDCALSIYKVSGNSWSPWVTWQNGSYLAHL